MDDRVINSINAQPETIESFLKNHEYVIPDYQRPYSWKIDECLKLWEDLLAFYKEKEDKQRDSYFLGTVVIYNKEGKRYVVDGQQRLITLNLFIKALLERCQTYTRLAKMLYQRDSKTDEVLKKEKQEIRVEHKVFGDNENEALKSVLQNPDPQKSNKYQNNYTIFLSEIDKLKYPTEQMDKLIKTIIDHVLILPIECTSFDAALTIFETINNRGLDLSDADIFKSKLYGYALAKGKKDTFIDKWNNIKEGLDNSNFSLKDVFSNYMHILRGKERNNDSIVGLRKFFLKNENENENDKLKDWKNVVSSIEKIIWGWNYITNKEYGADPEIINWANTLQAYTNSYWQYPIMTFLHKYTEEDKNNDDFKLNQENIEKLKSLLKVITRYCYLKWLKHRSLTPMKETIFKVVTAITHEEEYKSIINENLNDVQKSELKNILCNVSLGKGKRGICYLTATLHKGQKDIIPFDTSIHVEHILPTKWGHYKYNDWSDSKVKKYHDTIGNLVLLEGKNNIKASHRFFSEKKTYFKDSKIAEAKAIAKYKEWSPGEYKKRDETIYETLSRFFYET